MSMILGKPRPAYDREPSEKLGYRMTSPMISSASLACLIMRRSSANSMFGQTKKIIKTQFTNYTSFRMLVIN